MQIYNEHADHRDEFEIIAIHDSTVDSFAEMDSKLGEIREEFWKGESLPFPILLDDDGKTEKIFGVSSHPTQILIDPDGNVVGNSSPSSLEKHLTPLPKDVFWNRHRDMQKNVHWTWDEGATLGVIFKGFKRFAGDIWIEIDPEVTKKHGLSADSEIPVFIDGYGITVRSIEQMMFDSCGLSIELNAKGDGLTLVENPRSVTPPTFFQKLHNDRLKKRIESKKRKKQLGKSRTGNSDSAGKELSLIHI